MSRQPIGTARRVIGQDSFLKDSWIGRTALYQLSSHIYYGKLRADGTYPHTTRYVVVNSVEGLKFTDIDGREQNMPDEVVSFPANSNGEVLSWEPTDMQVIHGSRSHRALLLKLGFRSEWVHE